jgi:23S rRNA (uracil1939-C5)-methyltransferase
MVMLQLGQTLTLLVERPAVGGRMIARVDGQVVLVAGALPGERVSARIDRVGKGVAYAETVAVDEPSSDRRDPHTDPLCGGCLYAHITYQRQLEIKSVVIADAFRRIARLSLPARVPVAPSPTTGYRMRARLHRRGRRLGFFREGTHDVCDARTTGQLLAATCDVLDRVGAALAAMATDTVREVEVTENVDASERVVHLHTAPDTHASLDTLPSTIEHVTGMTMSVAAGCHVLRGSAQVTDQLVFANETTVRIRRHVLAFFQGNRFLLRDLAEHVSAQIPERSIVVDLYAGGGLFSVAAARLRHALVTAVEGDRVAADDLAANASLTDGAVTAVHQSVETFTAVRSNPNVVIVDPPRTGMSKEALASVMRLRAGRLVYVSCDVATLARDARRLVDSGYAITRADCFDLFPNTPHVETVVVFER